METYFGEIEEAHSRQARERALADLQTLARDAEELLQATAHDASGQAREARSRVMAALERAKSTIGELQGHTFDRVKVAARKTDTIIRGHPYESMGLAFGAGLLIGLLAIRRGRDGAE
jgi:ElaB/YqjD/DUF883 family membrane-anchored ribosome-binding protein